MQVVCNGEGRTCRSCFHKSAHEPIGTCISSFCETIEKSVKCVPVETLEGLFKELEAIMLKITNFNKETK